MTPDYLITLTELVEANVLIAPEMGFMLDSGAREIRESRGTLSEMVMR
jgi:hypothetical protein